jgi:hypothetical protein
MLASAAIAVVIAIVLYRITTKEVEKDYISLITLLQLPQGYISAPALVLSSLAITNYLGYNNLGVIASTGAIMGGILGIVLFSYLSGKKDGKGVYESNYSSLPALPNELNIAGMALVGTGALVASNLLTPYLTGLLGLDSSIRAANVLANITICLPIVTIGMMLLNRLYNLSEGLLFKPAIPG